MKQDLLTDVVYRRIREMIIVGTLPMGSKISESVLATKLSATKAPIRAALKKLQSEGLVNIIPKSGTFVFHVTPDEFNELLEFRYVVESEALSLAFEKNLKHLVQELSFIIDKMEWAITNNSKLEYLQLDNEFHQVIISFCMNRYFKESYDMICARMATTRNYLGSNEEHMERSLMQHKEIVNSLTSGDIDSSRKLLAEHILPQHGAYWKASNFTS
ncbi:GntR family transcriptional regulator [Vibrio fluminensis]|uniref:GntR family transcriptional regulator n=1 Tax=Vibrio fluminensis TaxID=2783614 RepID=UPI001886DF54|nr:GntR family transcriptional regulator [Vibrio fluminensis]